MTFNNDPRRNPNDTSQRSKPFERSNVLPLIVAAAIAVVLIAMVYPRTSQDRVGDTNNAAPSVQTVTPAPSPTTEPRPTQAPQP